jgi:hypothetical protein
MRKAAWRSDTRRKAAATRKGWHARPAYFTAMLSSPTGFAQFGAAGFVSRIPRVSTRAVEFKFLTVADFPNVFGCVPWMVKTASSSRSP